MLSDQSRKGRESQQANVCAPFIDAEYGMYIQEYFHELLKMERKRTERSKSPFLLLLIDLTVFDNPREKILVMDKLATALMNTTREIDVRGWYEYQTTIGVMFREMTGVDGYSSQIRDRILKRLYINLVRLLHEDVVRRIKVSSHVFPEEMDRQKSITMADVSLYPDLFLNKDYSLRMTGLIKKGMDLIGSGLGIILFSPLFLILAILIRVSSPGPVFFRQERIGRQGKPFTLLKFRSMYVTEDSALHKEYVKQFITKKDVQETNGDGGEAIYKITDDPRITPVGKFLRKSSLDELPQLCNVLKGHMSLVGPRPPIRYEYEMYDTWHRRRLLEVKPGITGLWQVCARSSTTFDDMVRLDLQYVRDHSLWLDIKILLLTPWVVLRGKGAY